MDVIIGAGISGISYANFTSNDYIILEKEFEIGGYCRTIKKDGFVWDYSGHFFHFQDPELEKYVCAHLDAKLLKKVYKHTQIYYNGRYIDFPFQKNIHQLSKDEFVDCIYDLFFPQNHKYDTFKDMVRTNLGDSIASKFLIPYNEKLYACDLNLLDANAMGRFFPKADKLDIIRNFKKRDDYSYNSTFVYPSGGAIEYVNSLAKNLSFDKIRLGESVFSIDLDNKTLVTNVGKVKFDNLISTMPFPLLLDCCGIEYDKTIYTANKVLVFNLGFDRKGNDTINSWVYIPSKDFIFYRLGYYDNIMEQDRMSLYVEIGFPENYEIDRPEDYLSVVLQDLERIGVVSCEQKLLTWHFVIMNPAYVHINERSIEATVKYKEILKKSNVYSIGRYGSWTYCSIEDNIKEARVLADKI